MYNICVYINLISCTYTHNISLSLYIYIYIIPLRTNYNICYV